MKKILSLALCALMLVSMLALVGCGDSKQDDQSTGTTKAPETTKATEPTQPSQPDPIPAVKFGAGVKGDFVVEDKPGQGTLNATFAAVLVDANGKIVACEIDAVKMVTVITAEKITPVTDKELKTKYEQGADYGMVAYAGATKEWFEQADAFEAQVIGKTLDEVKALEVDGGKGNDAVINAGCTITVSEMVLAVENAYNNAKAEVAADAKLKLTASSSQEAKEKSDAVKNSTNKLTTNIFAAAVNAEGKVLACSSDCVEATFTLGDNGKVAVDKADGRSKRQQGADYGMVKFGASAKEWFEHADAFDAACVGKTAAEITGLMAEDYKGIDSLKAAGCTIYVSGFVAAASKI